MANHTFNNFDMTYFDSPMQGTRLGSFAFSAIRFSLSFVLHFRLFIFHMFIVIAEVLEVWEGMGGEAWQIIEPVDGFHPNQIANALLAEVFFISSWYEWRLFCLQIQYKKLLANFSYLLPPINPNNEQIFQIFGNQVQIVFRTFIVLTLFSGRLLTVEHVLVLIQ